MPGKIAASAGIVATSLLVLVALTASARAAEGDDLVLDLGAGAAEPEPRAADAGVSARRLELRRIPKGTFGEGSPATEPGHEPDETQRSVTISRSFWIGKYPVTRSQFGRFVSETRHVTDAEKGSGGFGWDGKALVQRKDVSWRTPGFVITSESKAM